MNRGEWLGPLVTEPAHLKREATKRRRDYQELSVPKALVEEYLNQGWYVAREMKRKTVLRLPYPHHETLENRVWTLFHLLGYPELSMGRGFKIKIDRKGANPFGKQVDVFAKDEETVIVAECKSSAQVTRRSLQKDIEEMASLKGAMAEAINRHYGDQVKLKILWLFVTNNIVWSDPDKQRAAGARIHVVTERELRYYLQIADHLRSAARFQFLAEFFKDQSIPEMQNVRVPAIRGKLGGRTFYSFVSTPKQMLKIAFINHRLLNTPEGAPSYQRLVSRTRLRQIAKFLQDGGYFPTNILVNFPEKCRFDQIAKDEDTKVAFGHLYLPSKYRSAWIIDGQHRLYGYAPLSDRELDQNIMVAAFEDLDKTEEAKLFVTINHEQKSVSKSLLDELDGELKWGADRTAERIGAISARLISLLNNDVGEPLYGRVVDQGIKATDTTCLTVPELKGGLRRSGLLGTAIMGGKEYAPGPLSGLNDTLTLDRARSFFNGVFQQIQMANKQLWDNGRKGFLCTNTSIRAYLYLFGSVIAFMEAKKRIAPRELDPLVLIEEINEYLEPIITWLNGASSAQMEEQFKVQFGSGGPNEYYFRLCSLINKKFPDFTPDGFVEWNQAQSVELVAEADRQIKEINILVQKTIFDIFKEYYGLEQNAYWNRGVIDKTIKTNAYSKSLDDPDEYRLPLENYLDFIEYKKIVEHKDHWPLFKDIFDIPEPGQKGYSKNLKWIERINELRRIPAHATESRKYKLDDFDYIRFIFGELHRRVAAHRPKIGQEVAL